MESGASTIETVDVGDGCGALPGVCGYAWRLWLRLVVVGVAGDCWRGFGFWGNRWTEAVSERLNAKRGGVYIFYYYSSIAKNIFGTVKTPTDQTHRQARHTLW